MPEEGARLLVCPYRWMETWRWAFRLWCYRLEACTLIIRHSRVVHASRAPRDYASLDRGRPTPDLPAGLVLRCVLRGHSALAVARKLCVDSRYNDVRAIVDMMSAGAGQLSSRARKTVRLGAPSLTYYQLPSGSVGEQWHTVRCTADVGQDVSLSAGGTPPEPRRWCVQQATPPGRCLAPPLHSSPRA